LEDQMKLLAISVLGLLCGLPAVANCQLSGAIGVDGGIETTQFGGNNAYQFKQRSTPMIGIAPVITLGGNNSREHGWSTSVGGDFRFPTDTSNATGNPKEYAGNFSVDFRFGPMGLGGGVEGREFINPSDTNYARPNVFLFGVPFHYKVTFAPHNAAYVQAGVTIWAIGNAQSSGSSTTQTLHLSDVEGHNLDIRVTAGYVFGSKHTAVKFLYVHRGVYFDPTTSAGESVDGSDFKQNEFGGGVAFTF
jgi:hypothetical protein